jgi:malonate-semialdehyde dehydrogenase (acetylating)/methylmalonate-semialdehyde dehydrogenase
LQTEKSAIFASVFSAFGKRTLLQGTKYIAMAFSRASPRLGAAISSTFLSTKGARHTLRSFDSPWLTVAPRSRFISCTHLHGQASRSSMYELDPNVPNSHERIASPVSTHNFLDNEFHPSEATTWFDVHDPATNYVVTRVPQSTDAELRAAVLSAQRAFPGWKATSIMQRQQVMFKFVALIRENWDRLAASITLEQGKTFADARGDVLRGLQVAETACGITTQLPGQVLEVANNMETMSYKEPLGVVAAICPFSMFFRASYLHSRLTSYRFPSNDTVMVDSNCHGYWKLPHPEAFRA